MLANFGESEHKSKSYQGVDPYLQLLSPLQIVLFPSGRRRRPEASIVTFDPDGARRRRRIADPRKGYSRFDPFDQGAMRKDEHAKQEKADDPKKGSDTRVEGTLRASTGHEGIDRNE